MQANNPKYTLEMKTVPLHKGQAACTSPIRIIFAVATNKE